MASLWMESFDTVLTYAQVAARYTSPSGHSNAYGTGPVLEGRRGTRGWKSDNAGHYIFKHVTPGDATCITGAARLWTGATAALNTGPIFQIRDSSAVVHVSLYPNADGSMSVYRGTNAGTLLGSSAAGVLVAADGYHYIELKVTISDAAGIVVVRVTKTGAPVTVINLSGQDTRNAGVLGWSQVAMFGGLNTSSLAVIDDWYIFDGTGSENNDLYGDARVDAHTPNAEGTTSQSTPSTGSDRSAMVDDVTPNDDTDYNTIVNVGDKDTLNIQSLINTGAVPAAVQTCIRYRKTDAGAGSIAPVHRVSSDVDGTDVAADTVYTDVVTHFNRDPHGNVWTEANFNTLQVGYKRTA